MSLLVTKGASCLNLFHPVRTLACIIIYTQRVIRVTELIHLLH